MADDKPKKTVFLLQPDKLVEVFVSNLSATLADFHGDALSGKIETLVDTFMRINGARGNGNKTYAPGEDPYNRLVQMFVNKATMGAFGRFNEADQALWDRYSHPANFDFPANPDDLNAWSMLHYLSLAMKRELDKRQAAGERIEFQLSSEIAGFLANALAPAKLRAAIHELELNGNRVGSDPKYQAEIVFDILKKEGDFGIRREFTDEQDNIVPSDDNSAGTSPTTDGAVSASNIQHALDFIASLPDFAAHQTAELGKIRSLHDLISRPKPKDQRETLKMVLETNARLDPKTVDMYRKVDPKHILNARRAAIFVALEMEKDEGYVPVYMAPSHFYNAMYEQDKTKQVHDPILLAWGEKVSREDTARQDNKAHGTRKRVRMSLMDAWKGLKWSEMPGATKPKNDERIRFLLSQIHTHKLSIYSLDDVAWQLAKDPAADADKIDQLRDFALRLIEGRVKPSALWHRATKTKDSPLVPTPEYQAFCDVFKIDDAKAFIPPANQILNQAPVAKPTVPAQPAVAPVVAPQPVQAEQVKPEAPQETAPKTADDFTQAELVEATIKILGNPQQRKILDDVFDGSKLVTDMPSLPHMWMMWAVRPDTRMMGARQLVDAFQEFWNIPSSQRIAYEGTAKQQFIWAGVAAMRNKGALFENYRDFVKTVCAESGVDAAKAPSVPVILNALDIDALKGANEHRPELKGIDAVNAKEVVKWVESLPAAQSMLFGGRHAGRQYLKRMRAVVNTPKAKQG